jgi:Raf kinase inhibitor-like YbhB/YbcL family protein
VKNRIIFTFFLSSVIIACQAQKGEAQMKIASPAFAHNQSIPIKFTCQGEDINPQLDISGIPEGTKTLALIIDDPDAPMGMWVHWVVVNIPVQTATIAEDSVPGEQGYNDFGRVEYGGPCPPSGTHRYFFKIYALDMAIPFKPRMTKKDVEKAMAGHILDKAELIGLYKKI